ncbi:NitT/TauT family transport system permease protein [Prosthecobacter debontii]|uniref:NitT/TauT family transport system permease protein n=1 Tax=Prosthecobacter debontii TaxID=48467 RepID=A0A1T4YJL6_9BACT|nr:ABC transporter permease [Prosthecobacter debontii]SKB01451.1 NitT/TauT family transport system permease protein [Prosthecobacter debontii]
MASAGKHWFGVRKELDQARASLLMIMSFSLPLIVWCVAAYGPWWKVAHLVTISAESPRVQNIYTAGDRVDPVTWKQFTSAIEQDNEDIRAARKAGTPLTSSSRQNKKILRQLYPTAVINGWLNRGLETDDEAIRKVWTQLAKGQLEAPKQPLTDENLKIIQANAALLDQVAPEWPTESLLKLIPDSSEEVSRPVYLVPPDVVAKSFWKGISADAPSADSDEPGSERKTLLQRYGESWRTIVLGYLLAILVATPLGIIAGTFDFFSKLIEPFTNFFCYMPAPAFGVVLMAIFGLDLGPKIMLVFLGTLPCAILTIAKTTRRLDGSLLEAAQTLGANQRQLLAHVVVPGILPNLYNDLRLLFGTAWTWLVIAELLGFKSGLAEVIDTHGRRFQFDIVYPAILLIGLSGFFMDQLLDLIGRFLFPWMEQSRQSIITRLVSKIAGLTRRKFPAQIPSESTSTTTAS